MCPIPSSERRRSQRGFSLIELLIALVIGLMVVAGVMRLLVNSRTAYSTSEAQAHMLDGARFALHQISRDLRMAGGYGSNSWPGTIGGRLGTTSTLPNISGDCSPGFYRDVERKLYVVDDSVTAAGNPLVGGCIKAADIKPGSDLLVVRYADGRAVVDDNLSAGVVYVQSRSTRGELFVNTAAPTFAPNQNHRLMTHVYYVSKNTAADDGVPALHRISLVATADASGNKIPTMQDEVLVSGVENLQLQLGVDDCEFSPCDQSVNRYVDASNPLFGAVGWPTLREIDNIKALRVWLLMRSPSSDLEVGLNTAGSFVMGSKTVTVANDGVRRKLFSTAVNVRNQGRL